MLPWFVILILIYLLFDISVKILKKSKTNFAAIQSHRFKPKIEQMHFEYPHSAESTKSTKPLFH